MINDNGGTQDRGRLHVRRSTAAHPTAFAGPTAQNDLTVDAGSYSVTEPGSRRLHHELRQLRQRSRIANGETKTCTITNNDQPAKLIVKKIVINDNGGTKTAADFTFKVNGGNPHHVRGRRPATTSPSTPAPTRSPSRRRRLHRRRLRPTAASSRSPTADKTCTITNDDQAAKLIVIKLVINDNGGSKTAADFSFTVNGGNPTAFRGRRPERPHRRRRQLLGHRARGSRLHAPATTNCASSGSRTAATATCTITNNDQAAKLIVMKIVINDNGGTKTAADFTLAVNADSATPASFAGSSNGVHRLL